MNAHKFFDFLLIPLMLCWTLSSYGGPLTRDEKLLRLEASVKIARQYVRAALVNGNYERVARGNSMPSLLVDIREVLGNFSNEVEFLVELDSCPYGDGEVMGRVMRGTRQIHICDYAFGFSNEEIAEILIHEYAHSVGLYNECVATAVEFSAFIASGHTPYGNEYSLNHAECRPMTARMRMLADELLPEGERAKLIRPGSKVIFSMSVLSQIKTDLEAKGVYLSGSGPSRQLLAIETNQKAGASFVGPFIVKENNSENAVQIVITDAQNREFTLTAGGASQVPPTVSELKTFGVSFRSRN